MSTALRGIGMTSQRTRERMLARLREQGVRDEVVLAAMNTIPRHIFLDEALSIRAYEDVSLPIGFGQTISQPYIVARMTEILRDNRTLNKVLELHRQGKMPEQALADATFLLGEAYFQSHQYLSARRDYREVLDKADTPAPGVGAIRLRLVAVRDGAEPFALTGPDGKYLSEILLNLDYWALMPK